MDDEKLFRKNGWWCFLFLLKGKKYEVISPSYKEAQKKMAYLIKKGIVILVPIIAGIIIYVFL